jgi:hypothetical protein
VVEDKLLIAMDIVRSLEGAGANATMTTTVRHALILLEHDGLSAAHFGPCAQRWAYAVAGEWITECGLRAARRHSQRI